MGFPTKVKDEVLVATARRCALCHKFCGVKIELHHILPHGDGGEDTFENCIPLCFDCHADMKSYDFNHPKGTKYSLKELKQHRDNWYAKVKPRPEVPQLPVKKKFAKLDWTPIIVTNKNWYGDLLPTYAGIRIDSEGNCNTISARLKSVVRIEPSGKGEALDINILNPTNQFLRLDDEDNRCILKIMDDWSNKPRFLFSNMRDSEEMLPGNYELCIEITRLNSSPIEIRKILEIKKSHSTIKMNWKN